MSEASRRAAELELEVKQHLYGYFNISTGEAARMAHKLMPLIDTAIARAREERDKDDRMELGMLGGVPSGRHTSAGQQIARAWSEKSDDLADLIEMIDTAIARAREEEVEKATQEDKEAQATIERTHQEIARLQADLGRYMMANNAIARWLEQEPVRIARAVEGERERICTEALLWAHLSSNRSVSSALESFAHAQLAGKGPFNDERLNEFMRAAALRASISPDGSHEVCRACP